MSYVFPAFEPTSIAIQDVVARYAVHRIYCVGRNYAEHAREMGADPTREPPFFFLKPADAVVANDATIPYPPRTQNFHYEVELVVAIGKAGRNISLASALEHVYGYAVGIDLTRRDLQKQAKDAGKPWDTSKGFDRSAPVAAIRSMDNGGHIANASIWLKVNGERKQQANVADMIWSVPEIIAELSTLFELKPGDLIFTGTPAGVGALQKSDRVEAGIDGLQTLTVSVA